MKMIRFFVFFSLLCSSLNAQDKPDIYLPQVLLEVKDTETARLDLPDPFVEEQAPGLPGILVDDTSSPGRVPGLGDIPHIDPFSDGETFMPERRFFAEGTIGAGAGNRLYGNIELTQLGEDGPGFTVGFLHDGNDGFFPHEAGSGYFDRVDSLYGSFLRIGDTFSLFVEGDLGEDSWGFQGRSDFTDATYRSGSILIETEYRKDWFRAVMQGSGRYISQVLGGDVPEIQDHTELSPRLDLSGEWDLFSFGIFGLARFEAGRSWETGVYASFIPRPWLRFDSGVSAAGAEFSLPWHAAIEIGYFPGLTFGLEGGRRTEYTDPGRVLAIAPMSRLRAGYPAETFWFMQGSFAYALSNALALSGSALVYWDRDRYWLEEATAANGVLEFREEPYTDQNGGVYELECRYSRNLDWYLAAAYVMDYSPVERFGDRHSLTFSTEYTWLSYGLIGFASLELPFTAGESLPVLTFTLDIPVADNISLQFYGSDLLSAGMERGRVFIDDYVRKGFELSLFAKISL